MAKTREQNSRTRNPRRMHHAFWRIDFAKFSRSLHFWMTNLLKTIELIFFVLIQTFGRDVSCKLDKKRGGI